MDFYKHRWLYLLPIWFMAALVFSCKFENNVELKKGQVITSSITVKQDTYHFNGKDSLYIPVLTISGENITIDFNGATLQGSNDKKWPDEFYGAGILISGKNITLKNAHIHGFKVAVMAENVDSLTLVDCDFSYNYRQHLKSMREREDFADWLSYHQNEQDEWLRYGAAAYLKNCNHALVKNLKVTGGQNGLMMTKCNDGLFYNNTIQYNSGVGIGMYRSSRNRVLNNRLDWNVRGYSHGIYQRGQDSAGILVYEQSNNNIFANNSATHSGDGFFLWAGQTTMDTGEGGCNDNLIINNDFSHAPTNGIEVTFSSNKLIANRMDECRYGIWGGYSYDSEIAGNIISNCDYGVAIEHGNSNSITQNYFTKLKTGIQLWERESQPNGWGFSENRDVSSRNYQLTGNNFWKVDQPFKVEKTSEVFTENNSQDSFEIDSNIPAQDISSLIQQLQLQDFPIDVDKLKLDDAMDACLPKDHLRGRQYILVDEWGPYDFRSPSIWLREISGNDYTFLLLGPVQGNYKVTGGEGWEKLSRVSGAFPATLVATKKADAEWLTLDLEFIGEAFTDRFGKVNGKGQIYPFRYERFEKKLEWVVNFYNYQEATDPLVNVAAFVNLRNEIPDKSETKNDLYYAWWGSPGEGVQADRFATFSETDFEIDQGKYIISLTSDDGARLLLDGEVLIERWDIHEPTTDEVEAELGGNHHIEIQHFEGGGFGTLDFRLKKVSND